MRCVFSFLVFMLSFSLAYSHSFCPNALEEQVHNEHLEEVSHLLEKVYITPEQIEITDGGILFYDLEEDYPYPVNIVSYDENGLYAEVNRCDHQPKCRKCGGCYYFKNCPSNCICIKTVP